MIRYEMIGKKRRLKRPWTTERGFLVCRYSRCRLVVDDMLMLSNRVGPSRDMREKTDRYREREREKREIWIRGVTIVREEVVNLVHFSDCLRC